MKFRLWPCLLAYGCGVVLSIVDDFPCYRKQLQERGAVVGVGDSYEENNDLDCDDAAIKCS